MDLHSEGKILALPANVRVRLSWKRLPVTNTPAYYGTELDEGVKKFFLRHFQDKFLSPNNLKTTHIERKCQKK